MVSQRFGVVNCQSNVVVARSIKGDTQYKTTIFFNISKISEKTPALPAGVDYFDKSFDSGVLHSAASTKTS